jgi:hypothetical protein
MHKHFAPTLRPKRVEQERSEDTPGIVPGDQHKKTGNENGNDQHNANADEPTHAFAHGVVIQ